jgi:hypothetical protein
MTVFALNTQYELLKRMPKRPCGHQPNCNSSRIAPAPTYRDLVDEVRQAVAPRQVRERLVFGRGWCRKL